MPLPDSPVPLRRRKFDASTATNWLQKPHSNRLFAISLKKAQEDAAGLTPEAVAANMSPEEASRLSRVRNIGIAVGELAETELYTLTMELT